MEWTTWVFSGVGVAVPLAIIGWWLSHRRSLKHESGIDASGLKAGGDVRATSVGPRNIKIRRTRAGKDIVLRQRSGAGDPAPKD